MVLPSVKMSAKRNRPETTSCEIAKYFGRDHGRIMGFIQGLSAPAGFVDANFVLDTADDNPVYRITREGAIFLFMGFADDRAARIGKLKFIAAFNHFSHHHHTAAITTHTAASEITL